MQMLMNGGSYEDRRFFNPKTVELFTSRQTSTSSRALGWDTKSPTGYSSAGSLFGDKSFGHTGFTGTSIWTDPERKLFVILLTNRVYPTRNNMKIAKVRPAVHDAVVRALTADPTRLR
jgi:CubicO group peptidase (beta-lactamase class C family)